MQLMVGFGHEPRLGYSTLVASTIQIVHLCSLSLIYLGTVLDIERTSDYVSAQKI